MLLQIIIIHAIKKNQNSKKLKIIKKNEINKNKIKNKILIKMKIRTNC
jgi:hypothetical protein